MSTSGLDTGFNLQDLVKKVLLAFCEVHVSFTHRLDIYGSIHVRSDDSDLTCFVLNEHSYKQTDVRNKESGSDLTRYISSVNGNSAVETVCHQNSNFSGQVLTSTPNRKASSQTAEMNAKALSSCEPDSGHENHRALDTKGERATSKAIEKAETRSIMVRTRSAAADPVSDLDEPSSDVPRASSVTPDTKPHDISTEAETWPESTYDPIDEQDPSHYIQKTGSFIKNEEVEEGHDSLATVKLEPANENEIIELESDEEGYDQSNQAMFAYGQSGYDNSGMYQGYPSSSAPNAHSDGYSQVTWMQSSTSFQSPDDSQAFAAMNNTNKPPPQKFCNFCLKCFTTTVQLRMHIQRYHSTTPALEGANAGWRRRQGTLGGAAAPGTPGTDKRLTCSICMLSFRSLDGLRCHENSKHSRNKVYNCQFCSQVFLTRQAAYTHRTKFHRMKKNESPA